MRPQVSSICIISLFNMDFASAPSPEPCAHDTNGWYHGTMPPDIPSELCSRRSSCYGILGNSMRMYTLLAASGKPRSDPAEPLSAAEDLSAIDFGPVLAKVQDAAAEKRGPGGRHDVVKKQLEEMLRADSTLVRCKHDVHRMAIIQCLMMASMLGRQSVLSKTSIFTGVDVGSTRINLSQR